MYSVYILLYHDNKPSSVSLGLEMVEAVVSTLGGMLLVNPRRACAARVTVLGLSFRLSVCPSVRLLPRFLPLRATRRPKSDTNGFSTTLA